MRSFLRGRSAGDRLLKVGAECRRTSDDGRAEPFVKIAVGEPCERHFRGHRVTHGENQEEPGVAGFPVGEWLCAIAAPFFAVTILAWGRFMPSRPGPSRRRKRTIQTRRSRCSNGVQLPQERCPRVVLARALLLRRMVTLTVVTTRSAQSWRFLAALTTAARSAGLARKSARRGRVQVSRRRRAARASAGLAPPVRGTGIRGPRADVARRRRALRRARAGRLA